MVEASNGQPTGAGSTSGARAWQSQGPSRGRIGLLHGIMSSTGTWWRVGPALAALGWEVTAVDLAGHGRGPRPTGGLDLAGVAEHAAQALPQGLTVVVGHSLGAIVALSAAARHPGLARGLVLEEPPSSSHLDLELVAKGVEAQAGAVRSDRDTYRRRVRHDNPLWDDADVDSAVESLEALDVASIVSVLRAGQRWDLPQLVRSLAVPVLVIAAPAPMGPGTVLGGTALERLRT